MSIHLEAMGYHNLEQNDRKEQYGEEFEDWKQQNVIRMAEIEQKYEDGNLTKEDIDFIMQQATENVIMKWDTGEEFFRHHFARVREKERIRKDMTTMIEIIQAYRTTLESVCDAPAPFFGSKAFEELQKEANDGMATVRLKYRYFQNNILGE